MRKELFQTGATVEEAINTACLKLGYRREECEWEIIDLPKSSFFGLKKTPAKVHVWIELSPEQERKLKNLEKEINKSKEAEKPPVKKVEPKRETPPREKKPFKQAEVVKKEEPIPSTSNNASKMVSDNDKKRGTTEIDKAKEALAVEYLTDILNKMDVESEIKTRWEQGGLTIAVYGKKLGALIGRRGETLNSLQYLVSLVANRIEGEYLRILVDSGDYRLKRNDSIVDVAKKAADQALKTNVSKTLDVMNPAERRIVHATISEIPGVSSSSVGKDPYRRVIINTPTSRSSVGGGRSGSQRRPNDNRRVSSKPRYDKKNDRPPTVVKEAGKDLPEISSSKAGETPLYGKIEL